MYAGIIPLTVYDKKHDQHSVKHISVATCNTHAVCYRITYMPIIS
jgi:hypothetical protein